MPMRARTLLMFQEAMLVMAPASIGAAGASQCRWGLQKAPALQKEGPEEGMVLPNNINPRSRGGGTGAQGQRSSRSRKKTPSHTRGATGGNTNQQGRCGRSTYTKSHAKGRQPIMETGYEYR